MVYHLLPFAKVGQSSVASILVLGRGARPPNVPTETYIFSGLKIHLHIQSMHAVPFYYLWHDAV